MTIIYCAKDKQSEAVAQLTLPEPYDFRSPNDTAVEHNATRVIIVGAHPSIADRYKGIARIEQLELDEDEPETDD